MIRGAVYRIDLGDAKRGHEQRGKRYGIVLSSAPDTWSTVAVVPTSTSAQPAIFRPELEIEGRSTRALADQLKTIDTNYVIGDPVDYLTHEDLEQVEYAVARFLDLRINSQY
ncbi:type II toxin-antitoxin system PemK/MazF family toxin [Streptomyces sp. NPDC053513]|uniref:type II toxin-antitoxin system PemK/MazF family toxin n=1 Tax=unclassified Streptomyces TaxID=2593676 RepID=UPI0037D2AB80